MNELINLVVFMIGCYGASNILVNSKLFLPLREWIAYSNRVYDPNYGYLTSAVMRGGRISKFFSKLINCMLCVGFWVGCWASIFIVSPSLVSSAFSTYPDLNYHMSNLIFDGCIGSASAWIMHLLLLDKEEPEGQSQNSSTEQSIPAKACKSCTSKK